MSLAHLQAEDSNQEKIYLLILYICFNVTEKQIKKKIAQFIFFYYCIIRQVYLDIFHQIVITFNIPNAVILLALAALNGSVLVTIMMICSNK